MRLTGQRLLDRYVVRRRIARGGMGVVFEGDDERLRRPVCVKVFLPLDPSRPEYATVLEHFVQEAFTLSRLTHPNTLRIYDFGYLDATDRTGPFFVTEYADGGTLTDLLVERGNLAAAETLRILEPIVGALGEAHDASIVHRDIKPSNILFTRAGSGLMPKLCDFSIAKATGDLPHRAQDTNLHVPLYSLSWAAPEQLDDRPIGPGSDVFALGLTTLFMLTGIVVYPADDLMRGYSLRARGDEFRAQAIRDAGCTPGVTEVLLHACSENSQDRYPTVEAYYDALRDAFDDDRLPVDLADADLSFITHPIETSADGSTGPGRAPPAASPVASAVAEVTTLRILAPISPDPSPPAADHLVARPIERPSAPPRPRLEIGNLDADRIVLGNRRVTLRHAGDEVLTIPTTSGGEPARIRVTAVDVGGSRLHIKGLNCFVRAEGGRPSSGMDVKKSMTVELVTLPNTVTAALGIAIGSQVGRHHVCELPNASVVVPAALASWVVVLDLLPGPDAIVLFRRGNT